MSRFLRHSRKTHINKHTPFSKKFEASCGNSRATKFRQDLPMETNEKELRGICFKCIKIVATYIEGEWWNQP